jgi:hypothetical protein
MIFRILKFVQLLTKINIRLNFNWTLNIIHISILSKLILLSLYNPTV